MTVDEKAVEAASHAFFKSSEQTWKGRFREAITAYESARSAEPVASEIGEEEIARAIREELGVDWPYSGHEYLLDAARAVLALVLPAIERARVEERERAETAVAHCASLDENGYICEKSAAIAAIRKS